MPLYPHGHRRAQVDLTNFFEGRVLKNLERETRIKARQKALLIAKAAGELKGDEIVILDMRKTSNITDFFVICSAPSDRRVKAIADNIQEKLAERNYRIWHREGYVQALWILLDCGDVVVHVFKKDIRDFYNLEKLWADAPMKYLDYKQ